MIGIAIISFLLFLMILFFVQKRDILKFDEPVAAFIIRKRTPSLDKFFRFFTELGKSIPTSFIMILLLLIPGIRNTIGVNVVLSTMLAATLVFVIKKIFRRERPRTNRLVEESDHSFPSGHAATSVALYLGLAINAVVVLDFSSLFLILGLIPALCIGFSRVYLGIHYPTDVIGGFLFGLSITILIPII